jgi:hypothetical protein
MLVLAVAAANAVLGAECRDLELTDDCFDFSGQDQTTCEKYYQYYSSQTEYRPCKYQYDSSEQGYVCLVDADSCEDLDDSSGESPSTTDQPTTDSADRVIALAQEAEINDEELVFSKTDFEESMKSIYQTSECVTEPGACDTLTQVDACDQQSTDCDKKYDSSGKRCENSGTESGSSCTTTTTECTFTPVAPSTTACGELGNFIDKDGSDGNDVRGNNACKLYNNKESECKNAYVANDAGNDYRQCKYDASNSGSENTNQYDSCTMSNNVCSLPCTTKVFTCNLKQVSDGCHNFHNASNHMCIKPGGSGSTCVESSSTTNAGQGCKPAARRMRRDATTCELGQTKVFKFPELKYGGMIVDGSDPSKHENFYFGAGETKYDSADTPLTFAYKGSGAEEIVSVKISHPLVREYTTEARVFFWDTDHSWIPDRKELHADVSSVDTKIKIVKEDDGRKPFVGDKIALHSATHAINRTITGVTEVATANGDPHYEVELDAPVGADFAAVSTHVKLHEVSPSRKSDDDDNGLSDAELGGIIGGSIGGVLLLAVVAKRMMRNSGYNYLDQVA